MTVNKTLQNIYALYVFGELIFLKKIWRLGPYLFTKNVRMCRKNKFQVEIIKINSPKKNLAMWYIERGFGNVVCSCNFVICTVKYTHTCALGMGFKLIKYYI